MFNVLPMPCAMPPLPCWKMPTRRSSFFTKIPHSIFPSPSSDQNNQKWYHPKRLIRRSSMLPKLIPLLLITLGERASLLLSPKSMSRVTSLLCHSRYHFIFGLTEIKTAAIDPLGYDRRLFSHGGAGKPGVSGFTGDDSQRPFCYFSTRESEIPEYE